MTLSFSARESGTLTAVVVDRDGFIVRTLASGKAVERGPMRLTWDGRDDDGRIVADEAWSFKLDLAHTKGTETYFPASSQVSMIMVAPDYFDRQNGTLAYKLPFAARVHSQAGTASPNGPNSNRGAVLKTIVNRLPRPAGQVLESWDGLDESKTIRVPDLSTFVVAIAATPLPKNSVITVGNRSTTFIDAAKSRGGSSLLHAAHSHQAHAHHTGLTVFDDASPALSITPMGAKRERSTFWKLDNEQDFHLTLTGPTTEGFSRHDGKVTFYIDGVPVKDIASPRSTELTAQISLAGVAPGQHILAVNWHSDRGPVAANALRFAVE